MQLENKNIIITGASSGIGKATAIKCALEGANVILIGRNQSRLEVTATEIQKYTSKYPVQLCGDINDGNFIDNVLKTIDGLLIHGVALCAGEVSVIPIAFATEDKIKQIFNTNFYANANFIRLLLKKKLLKRGSSIVAVTSVLGLNGYMNGNAAYGASKAALESWIMTCALEYASKGIRFNTVHPGSINTPMLNLNSVTKEQMEKALDKIPMKRVGEPEEIAEPIIFLISDASSFITGTHLIADGGQHLIF